MTDLWLIPGCSLLFTGLLINRESITPAFRWLHTVSFFHAAFEALAVNELRWLQLKEIKVRTFVPVNGLNSHCYSQYGVELDLPAATILSVFGLRAQASSTTPFELRFDANSFVAVLLVAQYIAVGHLLCYVYGR